MESLVDVQQDAVVLGQCLARLKDYIGNYGHQAVTEQAHVHVTDVITLEEQVEEHMLLNQLVQLRVVLTQFVLLEYTDVYQENVQDAMDVEVT